MVDFRNYINPQPRGRFSAKWQADGMPDGVMYVEDKTGKIVDSLIRSVRDGSIVVVRRLFCLAPWSGTPNKRRRELARRVDTIKERGGAILEFETQRRSDARGQCSQMLMGAYDDIATAGRANPRGRMGRPERELTKEQEEAAARIWFSRRFRTRKEATAAIHSLGINVSTPYLYRRFGTPDKQAADPSEVVPVKPKIARKRRVVNYVYFIRSGNAVKIGISTAPKERLKGISTGNHSDLKLLAVMVGSRAREVAIHKKFKAHRIKGEWFHLVPEITKYISGVKKRRSKG